MLDFTCIGKAPKMHSGNIFIPFEMELYDSYFQQYGNMKQFSSFRKCTNSKVNNTRVPQYRPISGLGVKFYGIIPGSGQTAMKSSLISGWEKGRLDSYFEYWRFAFVALPRSSLVNNLHLRHYDSIP